MQLYEKIHSNRFNLLEKEKLNAKKKEHKITGSNKISNFSTTTFKMIRKFDVAPERVFDACLNPDMMRK
ncbi:hypothetical protein [Cytobacillus depressus]|uniref:hypothetical protein n=1 Tax=Cytobacillus depressus TaxID=1602942 RepID=UPI001FE9009A|nr:hypothetical protein [Cytobacillus depressus]